MRMRTARTVAIPQSSITETKSAPLDSSAEQDVRSHRAEATVDNREVINTRHRRDALDRCARCGIEYRQGEPFLSGRKVKAIEIGPRSDNGKPSCQSWRGSPAESLRSPRDCEKLRSHLTQRRTNYHVFPLVGQSPMHMHTAPCRLPPDGD
jgi:hypothetical protein